MSDQLIESVQPFEYTLDESEGSGKLRIKGIYQKSDTQNENGRIYPRRILEREVNSLQEMIRDNRLLGELNHPSCHFGTAQILTKDGWKCLKDISKNEIVATLNPELNVVEYHQIERKIDEEYEGEMIEFVGRNMKTTVTPNHRFYLIDRYGKGYFATAQEIYENRTKHSHSYIPKRGKWNAGFKENAVIVQGLDINDIPKNIPIERKKEYENDIIFDTKVLAGFLGIYLSEGYCDYSGSYGTIVICQKNGEKKDKIRDLLNKFPKNIKWKENNSRFITSDLRLSKILKPLGNKYNKKIPDFFKNLAPEFLMEILNWFMLGDGRDGKQYDKKYNFKNVFTVSRQLIEDLQEILFKSGNSGNITINESKEDYIYAEHLINAENKSSLYVLNFASSNGIYMDKRMMKINKIPFKGRVYCVTVPNHIVYIKDNETCFWSGNSAEINLERACHMISLLEMKSDGLVYGESLVLQGTPYGAILESLFRNGVKLGISSRGKGTTVYRNGVNEVNEDYKMITFDIVSRPSTPGAYPKAIVESSNELGKVIGIKMGDLVDKILKNEFTVKEATEILNRDPNNPKKFFSFKDYKMNKGDEGKK